MSRVEENNEALGRLTKYVMEKESETYEELVIANLSVVGCFLADISKSLAILADKAESEAKE